ncbi:MAG: guanylate kinase [Cyclobacteriaceae bacterium]|nr:guanylate kinase [Cyclobacteriaceae bacterium]
MSKKGKAIIFSAPSGSGKTTLVKKLILEFSRLQFSVSATTRKPRAGESEGREYYFISEEEFKERIDNNQFVEWEEVYNQGYYGTLKREVDSIWAKGNVVIFDVDVKGGCNLKEYFGEEALSIFVKVPSMEVLYERLVKRGTENEEEIKKRLGKASYEMSFEKYFDLVVINSTIEIAFEECKRYIQEFINN